MRHIDAAVIDERHLVPLGIWMKRVVAVGLWVFSLVGTYVFMNGNQWVWPFMQSTIITFAMAFIYQVFFSTAQFAWRQQWLSFWYLGALMASVIPSTLTYHHIDVPLWTAWKEASLQAGMSPSIVDALNWIFVFCLMVVIDAVPEQILVRRKQRHVHAVPKKSGQHQHQRPHQRAHPASSRDEDLLRDLLSQ
jgi:branched-subunit amino acid transport protein